MTTEISHVRVKSNVLMFFSAESDDSSAEPEEMDSGDDNDEAKWAQQDKRWVNLIHLYIEAHNKSNCNLHAIYVIREEGRREDNLPCWQCECVYAWYAK